MIKGQQKGDARYGPGYSIAAFAKKSGLPYRRVAKAVEAREIASVTLGGVKRIPETELPRIMALYGAEIATAAAAE